MSIILFGNALLIVGVLVKLFSTLRTTQTATLAIAGAVCFGSWISYLQNWAKRVSAEKLIWGLVLAMLFTTLALILAFAH